MEKNFIIELIKERINNNGALNSRYVGDEFMKVKQISLLPNACGSRHKNVYIGRICVNSVCIPSYKKEECYMISVEGKRYVIDSLIAPCESNKVFVNLCRYYGGDNEIEIEWDDDKVMDLEGLDIAELKELIFHCK